MSFQSRQSAEDNAAPPWDADRVEKALARTFRRESRGDRIGERPMSRFDVLHMIKRRPRLPPCPIPPAVTPGPQELRLYLENRGTLEHGQDIAHHESLRTTKLNDGTREELSFEELERIKI
jgi:hypothetical protein